MALVTFPGVLDSAVGDHGNPGCARRKSLGNRRDLRHAGAGDHAREKAVLGS